MTRGPNRLPHIISIYVECADAVEALRIGEMIVARGGRGELCSVACVPPDEDATPRTTTIWKGEDL